MVSKWPVIKWLTDHLFTVQLVHNYHFFILTCFCLICCFLQVVLMTTHLTYCNNYVDQYLRMVRFVHGLKCASLLFRELTFLPVVFI